MPLIRAMARTAVVAGTATAVSNRVSRRQANKWADQGQAAPAYMAEQPPPQQYQQPMEQLPVPGDDPMEKLKELGALHEQGILTDQEFADKKATLLSQI